MPNRSCSSDPSPPSGADSSHAGRDAQAWQAGAWVRGVAWAPALPVSGFQLGYHTGDGFDPIAGPVFNSLSAALSHARRTGWLT